jgi:hypothetical protein
MEEAISILDALKMAHVAARLSGALDLALKKHPEEKG